MIRVAIVEDKPEISSALQYIISSTEGFTCKAFKTAEAALEGITPSEFDVVLMDIQLPGMSGIDCTQLMKEKYPEIKIMMCTIFNDDEKIFRAIAAGASGYILKHKDPLLLIQAVKDLVEGGAPISSSIAERILTTFRKMIPFSMAMSDLSEREQEVLSLLATKLSNKEVADKLNVSLSTVKSHVYSIYQKLHVNSRAEAIKKFRKQAKS